jgi:hypothetical protein
LIKLLGDRTFDVTPQLDNSQNESKMVLHMETEWVKTMKLSKNRKTAGFEDNAFNLFWQTQS